MTWSTRQTSMPTERPKHAKDFYTDDLMVRVPKKEYLFKTTLVAR